MDTPWPRAREVEKPKPFADRAKAVIDKLEGLRNAAVLIGGPGNNTPAIWLGQAIVLLREAVTRGVKGKEPAP